MQRGPLKGSDKGAYGYSGEMKGNLRSYSTKEHQQGPLEWKVRNENSCN